MSLEINQIALHQLIKRDEQTLEVVLRDSLLEPTATVVEMMAELHRVYSAKNKAYGLFSEESELADSLRLQRQGEEDFLAFSRAPPGVCATSWRNIRSPTAGSCCFCHYRYAVRSSCSFIPIRMWSGWCPQSWTGSSATGRVLSGGSCPGRTGIFVRSPRVKTGIMPAAVGTGLRGLLVAYP
ncbi:nucleoid-associated protein [Enterobacter asburiae]|uniref:nucleoid-associated protein n=1 Tax=Enterobacter asburiae TaxID=61645 RepID=UPI001F3FE82C|nr:nucleoid-associated protein [Enterobacter asburiae]